MMIHTLLNLIRSYKNHLGYWTILLSITSLPLSQERPSIQWEVGHPLTLNYGAPIVSVDETIRVCGATLTHIVASIEAIGAQ